jgi:Spy/CpxP family protein refolding chaperone
MMYRKRNLAGVLLLCMGSVMMAQQAPPGNPAGNPAMREGFRATDHHEMHTEHIAPGPGGPGMHMGPQGKWWSNPELAQKLGLTKDQQKKMDDIFQQSRLKLIDLNASLQKEEVTLEPLMESDQPDEPKVLSQIDRVAQARAELEKANARMLLGLRQVLTPDQWQKLRAEAPRPEKIRTMGPGGPGGMGMPGGPGGPPPLE